MTRGRKNRHRKARQRTKMIAFIKQALYTRLKALVRPDGRIHRVDVITATVSFFTDLPANAPD